MNHASIDYLNYQYIPFHQNLDVDSLTEYDYNQYREFDLQILGVRKNNTYTHLNLVYTILLHNFHIHILLFLKDK